MAENRSTRLEFDMQTAGRPLSHAGEYFRTLAGTGEYRTAVLGKE
jgi:hypothetical protein